MKAAVVSVFVVVSVAVSGGCLVGELTGIPCEKDAQCPTNHFCDVPNGACASISDVDSAPDLDVVGVENGAGELQLDPFIAPDETTTLTLHIENSGLRDATNVTLDLTRLVCMNLVLDDDAVPALVSAGETVLVPFTVTPDGCTTPSIQDWFLFYSGRAKRGTFNINIDRAPPTTED